MYLKSVYQRKNRPRLAPDTDKNNCQAKLLRLITKQPPLKKERYA